MNSTIADLQYTNVQDSITLNSTIANLLNNLQYTNVQDSITMNSTIAI